METTKKQSKAYINALIDFYRSALKSEDFGGKYETKSFKKGEYRKIKIIKGKVTLIAELSREEYILYKSLEREVFFNNA